LTGWRTCSRFCISHTRAGTGCTTGTITLGKANPSPSIGVLIAFDSNFGNNNTIQVGNRGEGIQAVGSTPSPTTAPSPPETTASVF
jgi:hypothetical protein